MRIQARESFPGRRPLRIFVHPSDEFWIEYRPKFNLWDVCTFTHFGHIRAQRMIMRTDDLFAAVGVMLRRLRGVV